MISAKLLPLILLGLAAIFAGAVALFAPPRGSERDLEPEALAARLRFRRTMGVLAIVVGLAFVATHLFP